MMPACPVHGETNPPDGISITILLHLGGALLDGADALDANQAAQGALVLQSLAFVVQVVHVVVDLGRLLLDEHEVAQHAEDANGLAEVLAQVEVLLEAEVAAEDHEEQRVLKDEAGVNGGDDERSIVCLLELDGVRRAVDLPQAEPDEAEGQPQHHRDRELQGDLVVDGQREVGDGRQRGDCENLDAIPSEHHVGREPVVVEERAGLDRGRERPEEVKRQGHHHAREAEDEAQVLEELKLDHPGEVEDLAHGRHRRELVRQAREWLQL
mmetsp:Transcript_71058/g.183236  ORF Transcript_71058/g.183236 Transcript_71058/m.183236 type:complete len:268 (-) Transcript_71058:311-1114(-)